MPDVNRAAGHCPTCGGTSWCPSCRGAGQQAGVADSRGYCTVCVGSGRCPQCSGRGRVHDLEFEVHGSDAKEVERVAKALAEKGLKHAAKTNKVEIHLHNSSIGVLNTGQIEDVESIRVSVSTLSSKGDDDVANALKCVTEAVVQSSELTPEQRTELLDNLDELARQAAMQTTTRSKPAVIKSVFVGISTALASAGSMAEIWSTWGPAIRRFFGF
jgi:hypothetical protein